MTKPTLYFSASTGSDGAPRTGGNISNRFLYDALSRFAQCYSVKRPNRGVRVQGWRNKITSLPPAPALFDKALLHTAITAGGRGGILSSNRMISPAHIVSRQLDVPHIIIARDYYALPSASHNGEPDHHSIWRSVLDKAREPHVHVAHRTADLIIANSDYLSRKLKELYPQSAEIATVYPPIDLPTLSPRKEKKVNIVGFIGRSRVKGLDTVLSLADRFPALTFRIFGGQKTRVSAPSNVEFYGYIEDRTVLYEQADLFLVPSRWEEPFGRVAAESLISGKPVLAANKGGLPEAVTTSDFLVEDESIDAWQQALEWTIDSQSHLADLIRDCQRRIEKRYSVESHHQNVRARVLPVIACS